MVYDGFQWKEHADFYHVNRIVVFVIPPNPSKLLSARIYLPLFIAFLRLTFS
jgi:hypothetical protein